MRAMVAIEGESSIYSMSALGHKRTFALQRPCPLYPQKRTFIGVEGRVSFGPIADKYRSRRHSHYELKTEPLVSDLSGFYGPAFFWASAELTTGITSKSTRSWLQRHTCMNS